jgi:hypothetical protein
MTRQDEPRPIADPRPGYFKLRLVRRGPYVAARIACSWGFWTAEINGVLVRPSSPDPVAAGVFDIWTWGEAVSVEEYSMLLGSPPGDPYQPVLVSRRGWAEAMREQEDLDWWETRPLGGG